jgi:hypothetical protein
MVELSKKESRPIHMHKHLARLRNVPQKNESLCTSKVAFFTDGLFLFRETAKQTKRATVPRNISLVYHLSVSPNKRHEAKQK